MSRDERKTEASMPVQSRIDLRTLAELEEYWRISGYAVDNMSRLVAWSLDTFVQLLKVNGKIENPVKTLEEAYGRLMERGLIQRSMYKRMERKLVSARALENLRMDGWEVDRDGEFYQSLHKRNQVQSYPGGGVSDEEYKRVTGMTREEARKSLTGRDSKSIDEQIERQKANMIFDERGVYKGQKSKKRGREGITVNVERNLQRMKEADERLKDM